MNRKLKVDITLILAILFGITGFNIAIPAISSQAVNFAFGALLPFIICLIAFLDQFAKMKKEKSIVTATETAST